MNEIKVDYLIIGAGIVGLTIARELIINNPASKIVIIEKESDVAYHSSGRNSGVLHAGFYYTSDSLKAKFTKEGNAALTEYCISNNLNINRSKKVVVAKNEQELVGLYELEKRGKDNGVDVTLIDSDELAKIEPNAKTFEKALYSPTTSTIDPKEICNCIKNELQNKGVSFIFSDGFSKRKEGNVIVTSKGVTISAIKIINAAGLYADKIAKQFDFSKDYTIIPFKGLYLKYKGKDKPIDMNIYPVPDLANPFLGVHFTVTVDDIVKIGPTAIPAFWRENYKGFTRFKLGEFITILSWEAFLFLTNKFNFRTLAFMEIRKYSKKYFTNLGTVLVKEINVNKFKDKSEPGIRAQLLNKKTKELVQDFIIEGDKNSVHVLNAVSPAFTCSIPFAKHVVDNYIINK